MRRYVRHAARCARGQLRSLTPQTGRMRAVQVAAYANVPADTAPKEAVTRMMAWNPCMRQLAREHRS